MCMKILLHINVDFLPGVVGKIQRNFNNYFFIMFCNVL